MIAKVDYIKSIFKITGDNPYVISDIADDMAGVQNFDDFRVWLKSNINHIDTQYMNGFQKFTFLAKEYKKQYAKRTNSSRLSKSQDTAKQIADKIRSVAHHLDIDPNLTPHHFQIDGKCYFSKFEISQIEKIGGLHRCVMLQKSVSGEDALLERLRDEMAGIVMVQALAKPTEQTNVKVSKLMRGVAHGVRA